MAINKLQTSDTLIKWMNTINNIITEDETRDETINLIEEKVSTLEHPLVIDDSGQLCIRVQE